MPHRALQLVAQDIHAGRHAELVEQQAPQCGMIAVARRCVQPLTHQRDQVAIAECVDDPLARHGDDLLVAQRVIRQHQAAEHGRIESGFLQPVLHCGALHPALAQHIAFGVAIYLEDFAMAQQHRSRLDLDEKQAAVRRQNCHVDLAVAVARALQRVQGYAVEDFERRRQVVAQAREHFVLAKAPAVGTQRGQHVWGEDCHGRPC